MVICATSPFKVFDGARARCSADGAVIQGVNVAAVRGVSPLVGDDLTQQAPTTRAIVRGNPRKVVLLGTLIRNNRCEVKVNYQPLSSEKIVAKNPTRERNVINYCTDTAIE